MTRTIMTRGTKKAHTNDITPLFIFCPTGTLVKQSKASNELISHEPAPRLTAQPAQALAVALRPISPHCHAVVSRKRETKAETEGAPTYLNTMLPLPHDDGGRGRSASAARALHSKETHGAGEPRE